jgi:hypothetical protein
VAAKSETVRATRRSGFAGSYVIIDDLLRNAFGELNSQLVRVNCRYGSTTKHRVRNMVAYCILTCFGGVARWRRVSGIRF